MYCNLHNDAQKLCKAPQHRLGLHTVGNPKSLPCAAVHQLQPLSTGLPNSHLSALLLATLQLVRLTCGASTALQREAIAWQQPCLQTSRRAAQHASSACNTVIFMQCQRIPPRQTENALSDVLQALHISVGATAMLILSVKQRRCDPAESAAACLRGGAQRLH